MSRRYVDQLRDGDNLDDVYLATDKQLRANRNGNPYVQLELRDRTGGISARLWNAGDHVFRWFDNGDFVHADGKVQLFQGALQVILNHLERAEAQKVELADFLPQTEQDIGQADGAAPRLPRSGSATRTCGRWPSASSWTTSSSAAFTTCPAGVKLHHAYVGGLLEHTVTMMDMADRLLPLYPARGPRPAADRRVPARRRQDPRADLHAGRSATRTRASWSATSPSAVEMLGGDGRRRCRT